MNVTCPECSAAFDVPDAVLGTAGRRVRCASCGHIWFQEPVRENPFGGFQRFKDDLDIDPIPMSVHPEPQDDDDEDDEKSGGWRAVLAGLDAGPLARMVLGFVLGVTVLFAAAAWFQPPFLNPMLARLGVAEAHAEGRFEVMDVRFSQAKDDKGEMATTVTGRLVNKSPITVAVPVLDVTPVDKDGETGEGVRVTPDQKTLEAGAGVEFGARIQGQMPVGGTLRVTVVD